MADNRQFADHVEIGGANVYFKEEPTTGTTMPNTSYFKTEDVDGKPVKISRDNIMGIVKECLGTILNGGSDQTTVTKVPTLNGNTLGASAVSTLASVLGVIRDNITTNEFYNISSTDLQSGVYLITSSTSGRPGNGSRGVLLNINTLISYFKLQIVCYSNVTEAYIRCMTEDTGWGSWIQIQ